MNLIWIKLWLAIGIFWPYFSHFQSIFEGAKKLLTKCGSSHNRTLQNEAGSQNAEIKWRFYLVWVMSLCKIRLPHWVRLSQIVRLPHTARLAFTVRLPQHWGYLKQWGRLQQRGCLIHWSYLKQWCLTVRQADTVRFSQIVRLPHTVRISWTVRLPQMMKLH